jgi:hypothetical protein
VCAATRASHGGEDMKRRVFVFFCLFLTTCGKDTAEPLRAQTPADAASLVVTPGLIFTFPNQSVGGSVDRTFTVTNAGIKAATEMQSDFGLSITFLYPGGYPGAGGTCAASLAAGESCTLTVRFTPQYVGNFSQTLRISYSNAYSVVFTDYPVLKGDGT